MSIPITEVAPLTASSVEPSTAIVAPSPAPALRSDAASAPVANAVVDTFANNVGRLMAAMQTDDFATARRILPAVQNATWPFYPPARVGLTPQSAVQHDLRAFANAVLSGDTSLAQQAFTTLSVDMEGEAGKAPSSASSETLSDGPVSAPSR